MLEVLILSPSLMTEWFFLTLKNKQDGLETDFSPHSSLFILYPVIDSANCLRYTLTCAKALKTASKIAHDLYKHSPYNEPPKRHCILHLKLYDFQPQKKKDLLHLYSYFGFIKMHGYFTRCF